MLNIKILCRTFGSLLFVETGMFLLSLIVSICYGESDTNAFIISAIVSTTVGLIFKYIGRNSGSKLSRRDSFFIVAITWIVFSFMGTLPLLISGSCSNLTDAFFEAMSGFTTTGSTILNNVDEQPHGILFWRTLMHWIGGLGIIIFTLMLLPATGESNMRLFSAEATGLTHEKLHPRIRTTLKWLFSLYVALTIICAISLYICGMGWFDSINFAMSTTSTGGFSTHSEGLMFFHSSSIEYVEIFFIFVSGINFSLLYLMLLKRNLKILAQNNEFTFYLSSYLFVVGAAALALVFYSGYDWEPAIRTALINVVSLQTTTGFINEDIQHWWPPIWFLLFFVMILGASAGSTSGGIKCIRMFTLFRTATTHFRKMLHPNAYMPVRVNHTTVSESVEHSLLAFLFWYFLLLIIGSICFSLLGLSLFDAVNVAICSLSNVGVTNGTTFAATTNMSELPDVGKWICSFMMLAGRLEIFPLLLPLTPAFWENN